MPGFLKAVALVISGGAIVGTGAFEALPGHALAPLLAIAPVPDFARVPCNQQLWLNADRACQTWTVPHREVRRVLFAEPPEAEPAPELHVATASAPARRTIENANNKASVANNKARSVRSASSPTASRASAMPPRAAGAGGGRAITSRAAMESSL
jgi:hypothetical protein